MVTCCRMSLDKLCGEAIIQTTAPPPNKSIHIKVSVGSDRSWLIPVTTETSWPAFLAMFGEKVAGMEAQGASPKFEYNKQAIDGKLWHDLVEIAQTSTVELIMRDVLFHVKDADMQMANEHATRDVIENPTEGVQEGETVSQDAASRVLSSERTLSQFGKPTASTPFEPSQTLQLFKHLGSTSQMRDLADRLHDVLMANDRSRENGAYERCQASKAAHISSWLASNRQQGVDEGQSKEARLLRKSKRRIILLAKYLFCIFWPLDFEHPLIDKFWGALHQIAMREDEFYSQVFLSLSVPPLLFNSWCICICIDG